jgi:hypothetical protein
VEPDRRPLAGVGVGPVHRTVALLDEAHGVLRLRVLVRSDRVLVAG